MSKKKIALIIVILVLAGLVIYRVVAALAPPQVAEQEPINVRTAVAAADSLSTTSLLTGRVEAVDEAAVVPLVAGKVTAVNVSLGDHVEKDTVLFTIDNAQAGSNYTKAKLAYDNAKKDYERYGTLYEAGAISLQQYQGAELQLQVAGETLATASDALNYYTVKAPISGFVTSVNVAAGSIAAQTGPAVTLADTSQLQISVTVSEYLIGHLVLGDPVDVYIATLSEEPFTGTVTALSPAPALGTLTYPATISLDNKDGSLMAGMFAEVRIVSEHRDNVLCVPADAVFMRSGQPTVAVLENDLPVLKSVTTGIDDGELVEIVSGLTAGETIIVQGQQYVTEGEAVKIVE